jgi:cytochrome c551/c552
MTVQRTLIVFADDTDAAEDFTHALSMAKQPPWRPLPDGANPATVKQERMSQEETDELILTFLHRAAPRLQWGGNIIIPDKP